MRCNRSTVMTEAWAHFRKDAPYHRYTLNDLFRSCLRRVWIAEKARVKFADYQANAAVAGYEVKPGDMLEIEYGAESNWVRCKVASVGCHLAGVDIMLEVCAVALDTGEPFEFCSRVGDLWQRVIAADAKAA